MNDVRGMTLQQFYDVLEEMRSIYPFEANKTFIGNLRDLKLDSLMNVEIVTRDEKTGIQIVMSKGVDFRIGE